MQALSPDLVLNIDQKNWYQIHWFSYNRIKICSLFWTPRQYRWHSRRLECSQCLPTVRCFCCASTTQNLDKLGFDPIGLRIFSYANQLFQPEFPRFEISKTAAGAYALLVANVTLFKWDPWRYVEEWVGNSTSKFAIFTNRLEIPIKGIVLYKDHPFHREILNKLWKLEPFKSAPTWF